jgi:filamentous hemagglutinin family protein
MALRKYLRFTYILSFLLLNSEISEAQIIPDNTLPVNSSINNEEQVRHITNGSQVGDNLFHSFTEFSVPSEITAYFDNNLDVKNIISRVTGGSISNINGVIQSNGSANLFLINPSGMVFGPNATLNIGGSFVSSTASSIQFADGTRFSAINPSDPPLLTVNVPVGLSFEIPPGTISVKGSGHSLISPQDFIPVIEINENSGLRVNPGKTLALVGGNILLEGGNLTSEDGKIDLVSIESGFVSFSNVSANSLIFGYESNPKFSDIQLSQKASIVAYGIESNNIELYGNNIKIIDGSTILSQNQGWQGSGKLNINATGFVEVLGNSQYPQFRSSLISENIGEGKGANLTILAEQILVENGGRIKTANYGTGIGGNIILTTNIIKVSDVSLDSPSLYSEILTQTWNSGKGGDLSIETNDLFVNNSAGIGTATFASGVGGDITINADNKLESSGFSPLLFIFSSNISSFSFGDGNAGNIKLSTPELIIRDGSSVGSRTFSVGRGGNVLVNADFINVSGVLPATFSPSVLDASTFGSGNAGSLTIETTDLVIQNGGRVDTATLGSGNAGNLTINALNTIKVSGIVPGSLNPSLLDSSANILDEGLQKLLELPAIPTGNSGSVTINTRQLSVKNGGQVSVRNDGTGDAGQLQISANLIELDNKAKLNASTQSGNGGDITISSQNLTLRNNSSISAEANGIGNGGNISVKSQLIIAVPLENSDITANAFEGRGGNIEIEAKGIFGIESRTKLTLLSDINASSTLGINGTVQIDTLNSQIISTTTLLENIAQPPEITSICHANSNAEENTFVTTGTGGIPPSPDNFLSTNSGWSDRSTVPQIENSLKKPLPVVTTQVIEAQGWRQNPDGTVILTVDPTEVSPNSSQATLGCKQTSSSRITPSVKDRNLK